MSSQFIKKGLFIIIFRKRVNDQFSTVNEGLGMSIFGHFSILNTVNKTKLPLLLLVIAVVKIQGKFRKYFAPFFVTKDVICMYV